MIITPLPQSIYNTGDYGVHFRIPWMELKKVDYTMQKVNLEKVFNPWVGGLINPYTSFVEVYQSAHGEKPIVFSNVVLRYTGSDYFQKAARISADKRRIKY